jgi:SAM-dependent methyltransferase
MTTRSPLGAELHHYVGSRPPSLLCWGCGAVVTAFASNGTEDVTRHLCGCCGNITIRRSGIWRCLSPEQHRQYETFIREYEFVRAAEGRGSSDPAYYLALPYQDLSGRLAGQWKIRARTFDAIECNIVNPLAGRLLRPLRILDLGAGNGWLSYRLALTGHAPIAVDLLTNSSDGLGAAANYAPHLPAMFPRVQAALDQLPFASDTFDLAIFNASFHYSQDYRRTLAETIRCLRPRGSVVVADTPWYAREQSGEAMVEEKHARFRELYGFDSASIPSQEFLTPQRLGLLASEFNLNWRTFTPFYGLSWTLRPMRARLRGRRVPSQFRVYTAEIPTAEVAA